MLRVVKAIETTPFPLISGVTAKVVHLLAFMGRDDAEGLAANAGAFAYVSEFSPHVVLETARTSAPTPEFVREYT
jgi:hypothetical protein